MHLPLVAVLVLGLEWVNFVNPLTTIGCKSRHELHDVTSGNVLGRYVANEKSMAVSVGARCEILLYMEFKTLLTL